jgi:extracellular factor (EF) 3-hydroxypalmitic acid methyl ester biosynthesis protein
MTAQEMVPPTEVMTPNSQWTEEIMFLDSTRSLLRQGEVAQGRAGLRAGLRALWRQLTPETWRGWIEKTARRHPRHAIVQQCPITKHSFGKPRGYQGDAMLLKAKGISDE